MESKKISELEQYTGSADGFMVPGVADGETQKANLGTLVEQKAEAAEFLKPSGLKTINGESIVGSGDLNVAVMNPLKGTFLDTDTLPTEGREGDYIYVVNTGVMPRTANVWSWNGTAFADTGKSVENFGLSFASGQAVNTVGIDNEPTPGSNNLVKSGGVQNELALGAVYDVSAKNPTAGPNNDGKWESLSALLSDANLSTLIPTSVRKGGMSIKFIQSSDNKYMQYMYIGTSTAVADFTDVDNWQKSLTEYSLIKIAAWGATGSSETIDVNIGDVVYNSTTRLLRRKISENTFETISYIDGAIYQYDGNLYVWNGTDLSIVSTTPIEIAKDSRETTALLLKNGVVLTNSSYTYDIVDKYYTYGGGVFAVSGRRLNDASTVMVAAYAKDDTFIQYFYPSSTFEELTKVPVVLPKNTWYIKVHGNTIYNETKLYSLSQADMNARENSLALGQKQVLEKSISYPGKLILTDGRLYDSIEQDIVDRYDVGSGGYTIYVTGRVVPSASCVMVAAFDKFNAFIGGFLSSGTTGKDYVEKPISIPINTSYVLIHANISPEHQPNGSELFVYGFIDFEARQEINKLKEGDFPSTYEPEVCRRRFYKAMEEKCANFGMIGYIIEGPSGYGRYNAPSDEVKNPILGHGQAQMPITGMCRLIANSLNYPFLANLWSEKERVIKSENTDFSYTLTRSLDEHYGEQLESEYIILAWKTGTRTGSSAPFYTNLVCAATNYNLNGKVLAGYVHLELDPLLENEETNRCKAMKILFNIGETLLVNRSADISSLQTQLLGQSVAHAEVMVYPSYAAFMSNFNASANSDYRLYHYYNDNSPNVNTYSTIKVLTTQIVLDYVDDLDEVITITENDIFWAPYSGAIFSTGQKFTIRNLLYAFLMISSNQAGYALARIVGAKLLDKYGDEGLIPQGS